MSDLKEALLDAKYIDMISLADFVVRDCGLPENDDDGRMLPQANEIAAALFRWAAGVEASEANGLSLTPKVVDSEKSDDDYDEFGDPFPDAETAEAQKPSENNDTVDGSQKGDA